jgi:quinol monooxygenase YgiN
MSPEQPVAVIARIRAKRDQINPTRAALETLIGPTRAEPGCVEYTLHESADEPGLFAFFERLKSKQALDEHLQTPHVARLRARADELFAEPVDITLWRAL